MFRVLSRDTKACRILQGDEEDVASLDRDKAAVSEKLPHLPQEQKYAVPLLPVSPPSSLPLVLPPLVYLLSLHFYYHHLQNPHRSSTLPPPPTQ
ncbi:hypothetical protein SprV_0200589800 [Sparganum proliferum]